jgi:predicted double-glycine peptidase
MLSPHECRALFYLQKIYLFMGDGMRFPLIIGGCVVFAAIVSAAAFTSARQSAIGTTATPGVSVISLHDIAQENIATAQPTKMMHIPLVRQGRDYTCGVSCVQSLMRYAGYEFDVREEVLLERLGVDESGTPIPGMVDFLNNLRRSDEKNAVASATVRENMTITELIQFLDSGKPVICAIQAWQTNDSGGYELDCDYSRIWSSGHYVVAIGYDPERIYFMDPSTMGSYAYIPRAELDARWHCAGEMTPEGIERLEHTGIVVTISDPRYTPFGFYKIL